MLKVKIFFLLWRNYLRVRCVNASKLYKSWGIKNEECDEKLTEEETQTAWKLMMTMTSFVKILPSRGSCLAAAVTAQEILWRQNIPTNMYFGIKEEGFKIEAHAWLKAGSVFVTGGNGEKAGYMVGAVFSKGRKNNEC